MAELIDDGFELKLAVLLVVKANVIHVEAFAPRFARGREKHMDKSYPAFQVCGDSFGGWLQPAQIAIVFGAPR